ncbi:MAG: hypothetical protein ACPHK8_07360 [Thermoplasmatota archaeon]
MIGKIFAILGSLIFVGAAVIGGLFIFDAPVGGTVEDKDCINNLVDVKTDFFGLTSSAEVGAAQCASIQAGNYVKYYLRSERTSIFESKGGACIYDTENGPGGC